jgi:hypothetical protein
MGLAKKTIVFLKTPTFGVLHLFRFCLFLIEKIKASIDYSYPKGNPIFTLSLDLLSPPIPSFSGVRKVRTFY